MALPDGPSFQTWKMADTTANTVDHGWRDERWYFVLPGLMTMEAYLWEAWRERDRG